MELFKVPPRWLFLKLTTDDGIVGWGEPIVEGKADAVRACVEELKDQLLGREAGNIEELWQTMYRCNFYRGGSRPYQRHVRHRTGAVGCQRQGAGCASV